MDSDYRIITADEMHLRATVPIEDGEVLLTVLGSSRTQGDAAASDSVAAPVQAR